MPFRSQSISKSDICGLTRFVCEVLLSWIHKLTATRIQGIVQDDPYELQQEIANQAKIYQNGAVTILAGGASSAQAGFLYPRTRSLPRYTITTQMSDGKVVPLVLDERPWELEVWNGGRHADPINERAWM